MQRKPTIGLLTPFFGGNYLGELINSIQKAVQSSGARLLAIRTAGKPFDCPIAMDHVDGWIILNVAVTDEYIQELSERWKKPIVTISKDITSLRVNGQMVVCDNEGAIMKAVEHLYEHGHRSIGFVGHISLDDMKLRLSGYKKALELHQLPFNPEYIIDAGDFSMLGGRVAAQRIVDAGFPFNAAVVCTDMMAIGLIERLMELGYHVPDDFALIGFDDTATAKTSKPSISSINQNIPTAGAMAVNLVLRQMEEKAPYPPQRHLIECALVTRDSCGCSSRHEEWKPSKPALQAFASDKNRMAQLGIHYEFNKFILNYTIEKIRDLSWALAPHFHWGSLGLWNERSSISNHLTINECFHFHKNEDIIPISEHGHKIVIDVTSYPPYDQIISENFAEESEMTYLIPYRTIQDNWSVLALGTSLRNAVSKMNDYMSVVHYLDLIATTLDRQALIEELKEQGTQYRQIAEQLEIVSRTSNDGIWELDLVTGEVIWNQRFYDLLCTTEANRFEMLIHTDDWIAYQHAFNAHMETQAAFMVDARLLKHSGEYVWVVISGEVLRDSEGKPIRMVGSVRDITERKQAEDKMRYLAYHDALTGLTNRRRFYDEITAAAQITEQSFAVIVLDLDHFKKVNDSYGHQMGDRLLQLAADGLKQLVRKNDHIARFGGDEFVIMYQFDEIAEVEAFAQSISKNLSSLLLEEGINLTITLSAGISVFPRDGGDADTLIKKADIAMYKVKQDGKNHYEIFSQQMIEQTMWRLNTENELKDAVAKGQFVLHYQPQIHMETGELFGVEALLRWHSPTRGIISPLTFIPLAEETGLIVPIGEWVIEEACRQSTEWLNRGYKPLKISVNISGQQLKQPDFVHRVKRIVEKTGMNPHYLCIEITESTVIDDLDSTIKMFKQLSELGIHMSMDDFGTGYSSLSVLKRLPLNMLKIDKSFIREMTHEHQDFDIVKAIISISKSLKLQIVAEGVEQREQYDLLQELGCHYMQGYYISKPLTAEQLEKDILVSL
ncbi:diguanylate cyclase (GGDEF)-like protein/PAS domain S-box-containing protein [Paenibacillus castaneae]|uniref:EAL domain-containing protein n=1 Tax=Paenibacillus castaneae TaxID=474957 RepID=UPI000C9C32E9|nr:EAL domain-containing protein [Paenibacillus castaneae]NIK80332.1 diguanylate cyclase (GGDEF)-like protein/PAS domain S-box-containing protein [Paenibacillus castaneae]